MEYVQYGKEYGKSLTKDTVGTGFERFFFQGLGTASLSQRLIIVKSIRDRVRKFRMVLSTEGLRLISSSLLIFYDAGEGDTSGETHADIRLIDFGHSHFLDGVGADDDVANALAELEDNFNTMISTKSRSLEKADASP